MINSSLTLADKLSAMVQNNMHGIQNYPFLFSHLFNCNFTARKGFSGWLMLGPLIAEYDDHHAWEFMPLFTVGKFRIAREMTLAEQEEALEAAAELGFMEQEANRYTEWSY